MIRLLKYLPVVLSIVGVLRNARKDNAVKNARPDGKRRSTFRN